MNAKSVKITREQHGDELYIYFNGELVYKRWINRGYGRLFHGAEGTRELQAKVAAERQVSKL